MPELDGSLLLGEIYDPSLPRGDFPRRAVELSDISDLTAPNKGRVGRGGAGGRRK